MKSKTKKQFVVLYDNDEVDGIHTSRADAENRARELIEFGGYDDTIVSEITPLIRFQRASGVKVVPV